MRKTQQVSDLTESRSFIIPGRNQAKLVLYSAVVGFEFVRGGTQLHESQNLNKRKVKAKTRLGTPPPNK